MDHRELPEPGEPGWWRDRTWRLRLNVLLFDFHCRAGRYVNYTIGLLIIAAVLTSMTESVPYYQQHYKTLLDRLEFDFALIFTVEYLLRIYSAARPMRYILSFNGIVDLTAVLPLLISGDSTLIIRLLRVMRLIKLTSYLPALTALFRAMTDVMHLMMMVIAAIILMSLLAGNLIYIVEPETFHTAFDGAWWSLVTMSTVGYGDLYPVTPLGRLIAGVVILSGITMFAMATAVVSVRVGRHLLERKRCRSCRHSLADDHYYCPHCGTRTEFGAGDIEDDPEFAFPKPKERAEEQRTKR